MITRSKEHYENRIALLSARDPVANAKIIKKMQRKLRQLFF